MRLTYIQLLRRLEQYPFVKVRYSDGERWAVCNTRILRCKKPLAAFNKNPLALSPILYVVPISFMEYITFKNGFL